MLPDSLAYLDQKWQHSSPIELSVLSVLSQIAKLLISSKRTSSCASFVDEDTQEDPKAGAKW